MDGRCSSDSDSGGTSGGRRQEGGVNGMLIKADGSDQWQGAEMVGGVGPKGL